MKKLGTFLMLVVAMAIAMPASYAQYDKMLKKEQKKEYKKKLKEYKKGKWEVYGTSHTLEVAMLNHYNKLQDEDAKELHGVASSFMSKNIGRQAAMNSAINDYARQAQTVVRGRVLSDIFSDSDDVPAEFDKFYAAYESMVVKEIKGEMEPTYSIIRSKGKDKDGKETFEMQSFFVVNETKASKARLRALENALKESSIAEKYASQVSEFVREGFDLNGGE